MNFKQVIEKLYSEMHSDMLQPEHLREYDDTQENQEIEEVYNKIVIHNENPESLDIDVVDSIEGYYEDHIGPLGLGSDSNYKGPHE